MRSSTIKASKQVLQLLSRAAFEVIILGIKGQSRDFSQYFFLILSEVNIIYFFKSDVHMLLLKFNLHSNIAKHLI
jgi:hypothetical protein